MAHQPELRIRLLGPFEVTVDGAPASVPGGKPRVLLAALALAAGQPVTVERLASRLWADEPPERIRGSLHTYVVRLRRVVGADTIRTGPSGYLLGIDPDHVDLLRFRRLIAEAREQTEPARERNLLGRALELWRGEPLSGLRSESFDRDEVPGLLDEWLCSLERRVDLDLAAGEHARLVTELLDLTARYPLRESIWSRLITALYRSGRQAEALNSYATVRARLREELGAEPGAELQRLHLDILNGRDSTAQPAADETGTGEPAGTPSPEPPAAAVTPEPAPAEPAGPPRQLPSDIPRFTGRTGDLAALDRLFADLPGQPHGPVVIAAVVGAAGSGKTALAVHWAHRVRDRFPDGQLYVNLHGYSADQPVPPAAALDGFLRALGVPANQIPDGESERSAVLRSTLAGRRMLMLLDNARDADQVRPLLPGSDCLVLVTSRNQLRGLASREGAHRLTLGRLGTADATALLANVIGGDRLAGEAASAAELVGLSGQLPLALRITGERVNRYPDLPLADVVVELRDEQPLDALRDEDDRSTDLRAVFSCSYRALGPAAARLFRLLGLHPGTDIGLPAAAALAGLSTAETRRLLDRLVALHLLEQRNPGRYEFHDLLRVYAAELAHRTESPAERATVVRRMLDWYLHTAHQGGLALYRDQDLHLPEPDGAAPLQLHGYTEALAWFDTERVNLVAVVRHAARLGHYDTATGISRCMRSYFMNRAHWDDWIATNTTALAAARRSGDRLAESFELDGLGTAHLHQNRYQEALVWYQQALELLDPGEDTRRRASSMANIGLAHLYLGNLEEAIDWQQRVLASKWADSTPALLNLGASYGALGRYQDALSYSLRALELHTAQGEQRKCANALSNVAESYLCLDQLDRTEECCRQGLELCREIGYRRGEAVFLTLLGRTLNKRADRTAAEKALHQALDILASIGDTSSPLAQEARNELTPPQPSVI